jgi:hypothetical protein
VTGLSSTSAGGPGAASTAPDGLELAIDGFYDKVVQSALVPDGGEPMGIYKNLERLLAPAINQGLALKTEKKVFMISSSRKQRMNCFHQENFNVG